MEDRALCFVINRLDRGGAERLLVSQINELIKRGKENIYLITLFPEKTDNSYEQDLLLPAPRRFCIRLKGRFDIFGILKIRKFLKEKKVETVVTSLWLSNFVGRLASFGCAMRTISYEQNVVFQKGKILLFIDRLLQHITYKIVAVSETVKYSLIESGIDENKIVVSHNAIDDSFFAVKAKSGSNIFLFLARLVPHKRADMVVDCFKKIKAQVIIGGAGSEKENLVGRSRGFENIVFEGLVTDSQNFYSKGEFFIVASEHEGLPLTLLEAMAAGSIPIVSDSSALREVVSYNENGLIFKAGDVHDLVSIIEKALKMTKTERDHMRQAAILRAKDFSIKNNVDTLMTLTK